jgi:putative ATP-binding cassette transporter
MTAINTVRNEAEGDHRFALVRLRENSEGVALIRGEADEERGLRRAFGRVSRVMQDLNRVERHLMVLSSAYGMMTHVFPILVASPRYFAGAISLGVLMQVGSAFGEVTRALTWFMTNYPRVADWVSHVERVVELEDSLDAAARLARQGAIAVEEGAAADGTEAVSLHGLSVSAPDGRVLVLRADAVIRAGERVLIQGESGTGKSTLFRALAGAWPWGAGRICVPERGAAMFLPQRPYLPLGSLRAALAYPAQAEAFSETAMDAALARCGLARLAGRLDEEARWDRTLSLGEQQRLAFARALLHRPRWIFLDEATAALDEANQDAMMRLLGDELPASAVVSIGHRPGLDRYHDRVLTLRATPEAPCCTTLKRRKPLRSRPSLSRCARPSPSRRQRRPSRRASRPRAAAPRRTATRACSTAASSVPKRRGALAALQPRRRSTMSTPATGAPRSCRKMPSAAPRARKRRRRGSPRGQGRADSAWFR